MDKHDYHTAIENYTARLLRFAKKLLQDQALAEDVVQESFLKLWENRAKVAEDKAKSWLFTTAYRMALYQISHQKRKVYTVEEGWFTQNESSDLKEILEKCLSTLPEIQRSILMLRDYEGYEYKEIGHILEISESQVKVYLFRARGKMKELIKDLNLVL